MKTISFFLMIVFVLSAFSAPAAAGGPWRGKIIDIETKEPIEGAVVLAVWQRAYRTVSGDKTYFYEAKEVLTDKEGNFEIPAYTPINLLPIISYIRGPEFTIFKPAYERYPGNELIVFPIKNINVVKSVKWKDSQNLESIEQGIEKEGIMFINRSLIEKIDRDVYLKKIAPYSIVFIPLEDSENKVRNLKIPFDYEITGDLDNVWRVWPDSLPKPFEVYTVVGLKKLRTREERIKKLPSGLMYEEAEKKAKNYMHLLNVERHNLGLDPIPMERRQYK